MYAHYRMEADQTDSIVVAATKEEWGDVVAFMKSSPYWPPSHWAPVELVVCLHEKGVGD